MNCERDFVRWANGINSVLYNAQVISLNERTDQFIFFDEAQSAFIRLLFESKISCLPQESKSLAEDLVSAGIISYHDSVTVEPFLDVKKSAGAYECDWRLGDARWFLSSLRPVRLAKSITYLKMARKAVGNGDLQALLNKLRNSRSAQAFANQKQLVCIGRNVNFAVRLVGFEVKCLEFAYCLARIALEEGLGFTFKIGVQTHPFISHAWVEGPTGVVLDKPELPLELAVIVSIGTL